MAQARLFCQTQFASVSSRLGVCDCAVVSQAMVCKRPANNIQCANVCAVAVETEPRRTLAHDQIVLDDEHTYTGAVNKKRAKSFNDGIAAMVSVGHQMVDASEDVQVPLSEKVFTQCICDYESLHDARQTLGIGVVCRGYCARSVKRRSGRQVFFLPCSLVKSDPQVPP